MRSALGVFSAPTFPISGPVPPPWPGLARDRLEASMASAASNDPDDDHARMEVILRRLLQRTREEVDEEDEADARDDDEFMGRRQQPSRLTRSRREFEMPTMPLRSFATEQSHNNQQQPQQPSPQQEENTRSSDLEQRLQQMRSSVVGAADTDTASPAVEVANDPSSKKRRKLVYPYPGGIYGAFCEIPVVGKSDGFRQRTGFSRQEFDDFYAAQGGDRGHLFKQPRNHYGEHSEEKNAKRRTIRGLLSDRDRVLCWLEMLRHDVNFDEMTSQYGPSKATFHNDFKWMTMAARTMPFLLDEVQWPSAEERAAHARFMGERGHPDMNRVVYIAGSTKVGMRIPLRMDNGRKGADEEVYSTHYSKKGGLGWSHIVYVDVRGKLVRIETVEGCCSDREAHCASDLYEDPESLLSEGETGMGDGNYRGTARCGSDDIHTCVPYPDTGDLSVDEKIFNSRQRRFRVVVEYTIGQIKKWGVVGGKAFRHQRDFVVPVFEVCAGLTARLMRVRGKYPRGAEWVGDGLTDWEAKLGVFLWMDCRDSKSYLAHGLEEDSVYAGWSKRKGRLLQQRWDEIRDMEEF